MQSIFSKIKRPNLCLLLAIYFIFCIVVVKHKVFDYLTLSENYAKTLNNEYSGQSYFKPNLLKLENLLDENHILKTSNEQNIYFLETHMNGTRIIDNARQACSVESAGGIVTYLSKLIGTYQENRNSNFTRLKVNFFVARINPDANIYLILLTNEPQVWLEYSDLAKVLLGYDNIRIRFLNIYEFSKGTALESLIFSNLILRSKYPIEHMADVMRALILAEYPGLYLDLDILSIFPLSVIGYENFACPESLNRVTNAVIRVNKSGQKVMDYYVE